jgi:hypothetical protein
MFLLAKSDVMSFTSSNETTHGNGFICKNMALNVNLPSFEMAAAGKFK